MPNYPALVGSHPCGKAQPLLWIAGPCVLESETMALEIAEELARVAGLLSIPFIFKRFSFSSASATTGSLTVLAG